MRLRFGASLLAGLLLSLVPATPGAQADEPAAAHIAHKTPAPGHVGETSLLTRAMARVNERLANYPHDPEASLLKGILLFKTGRFADARDELERLTRREPGFHLAHLVYGDLLLARAHAFRGDGYAPSSALAGLREEAEARLKALLDSIPQDRVPRALLALDDQVRTALIVDKASHRLYVYAYAGAGEPPRLVRDFYVSTGKEHGNKRMRGDLRTPEGVYFVIDHIPASRLTDKYGVAAYPINYPNELDVKLGKTGDGIWLHGTEERAYYSRPPLDSEGCVVLPNPDLLILGGYLEPGVTPVVIAERVQWLTREHWQRLRREVLAALESWRADWERGDKKRLSAHYSPGFWGEAPGARDGSAGQRHVPGQMHPRVRLKDISAFSYPQTAGDTRELVVIDLRLDYRSQGFHDEGARRLYLAKEAGRWKVLYESGR